MLQEHYSCESLAVQATLGKAAQSHFCLYCDLDLPLKKPQSREERDQWRHSN